MAQKQTTKLAGGINPDAVAAVIDSNGRLQASFQGIDAEADANHHKRCCDKGKLKHMHGSTVVTGELAEKAMKLDREGKRL